MKEHGFRGVCVHIYGFDVPIHDAKIELNRALRDLRTESGLRALIIAAEGKAFSEGVAVEDHLPEVVQEMLGAFHEVFRQLRVLACPAIAAVHFPHRIGLARTMHFSLSGEVLPAAEAHRIGLVDRVVPAGELAGAVEEAAARLREKSGPVLRLARRAVFAGVGRDFESDLAEAERLFLDQLMKTADAMEGLRSFLEKRAPVWRHR